MGVTTRANPGDVVLSQVQIQFPGLKSTIMIMSGAFQTSFKTVEPWRRRGNYKQRETSSMPNGTKLGSFKRSRKAKWWNVDSLGMNSEVMSYSVSSWVVR